MMKIKQIAARILRLFLLIPLGLIKIPLCIFRQIRTKTSHTLNSLKFSMRRKITLNYLTVYFFASILILIFMISTFMTLRFQEKSSSIYSYVDEAVRKYEQGTYDFRDLQQRINGIAQTNSCGIRLSFANSSEIVLSEKYAGFNYPNDIVENAKVFFANKVYPDLMESYFASSDSDGLETAYIRLIYPIAPFYDQVVIMTWMLVICLAVGFIMMWFFGNINNRRLLEPIYDMTRTAEKITIRNIAQELDVGEAKYELKDLAITLNAMIKRLKKDYEKQKRFVSDVSHELRTPIAIINGYAGMLKRWGKEDEAVLNESVDAIMDEAKNMQTLVENLLTLVRADNQTLQFNPEKFYLSEMVHEVVLESKMINGKNQQILCSCDEPIEANLDINMTKQMLRIFADNAVKYTPSDGRIEIRCEKKQGGYRIIIKDNGIGIGPEDLNHIFDRFYRSDESRARETGGHGLGLSIAKAIIIGQNGKIRVKSKLGLGTEFTIEF